MISLLAAAVLAAPTSLWDVEGLELTLGEPVPTRWTLAGARLQLGTSATRASLVDEKGRRASASFTMHNETGREAVIRILVHVPDPGSPLGDYRVGRSLRARSPLGDRLWMLGGLARRPNSELPVRLTLEPLDRVNRPFQRDIEPLVRALRGESPLMEALARRPRDLAGLFTHERHLATALELGPGDRWFRPSRGSAGFALIRTENRSAE